MRTDRKMLLGICLLFLAPGLFAQQLPKDERMQWWREARFGMFIHWGVYSQWGGVYKGHEQARGGAEWIMNRCKIPVAEYQEKAKSFNPVRYDADEWVRIARDAGMKYIVITAKHHDGFAMFKSGVSPFNIADWTTYGKDVLKPLAEACRKYGIKLGFYYSQAQDWNNPGGSAARKKMKEGWPNPDSTKIDAYTEAHKGHWDPKQEEATFGEYIDGVAIPQVKELLTNYGDIAVLWWDTPVGMTDEAALKLQELLKLQPHIITNDRLKRPNFPGDTGTPEQKIPGAEELDGRDWETCMTMNHTWGYRTSDTDWKPAETLIRNLVDITSKGGNYLLNVGPKPDGTFPQASVDRLKAVGKWMDVNGEAVYATKASPMGLVDWGRFTIKENQGNTIVYANVFDWPETGKLEISGLKNPVVSAELLADGASLKVENNKDGVTIGIPRQAPDAIASVIRLTVKGKIEPAGRKGAEKMKTGSID